MNLKSIIFFVFCLISIQNYAQETYFITYEKFSHDKEVEENNPIQVISNNQETIIGTQNSFTSNKKFPNEMFYYNKEKSPIVSSITQFDSIQSIISNDSVSLNKTLFTITKETKRILGLRCKKATTIINSNKIDLWFVDNLNINAAPTTLGVNLGFVLEMTRNNNYTIRAAKIERLKDVMQPSSYIQKELNQEPLDLLTYKDIIWKNKFVNIPLLENQQINFTDYVNSTDSLYRFANGTVVVKKVKLPEINPKSQIFLNVKQISNGDAYDRTGSVFIIPTTSEITFMNALQQGINQLPIYTNGNNKKYQGYFLTDNYSPVIELMRFFTPFGINKFNYIELKDQTWQSEAKYRQEISEFQSILSNQEVLIGFYIGNYDQGGHLVSANLTIHPSGETTIPNQKVLPIFNTVNVMEMAGQEYSSLFNDPNGLRVEFTLKEDLNNAKLRFTTTGHGGWENGDEFVPKENTIFVDNQKVFNIIPWRQDCGSYRDFNPASGNFNNGLSSSDYSRSNWCPGTITNPYFINLGNLKAGKHSVQVKIPQGKPEGSSFSYWNVSGILLGE